MTKKSKKKVVAKLAVKPKAAEVVVAKASSLFDAWASLNGVVSPDRSRFDVLREKLDLCPSEDEARALIRDEEFGDRYPLMPKNWKYAKSNLLILGVEEAVRLDFGCGQNPKEGFEGVDLYAPEVKHRVDLWKFPLPWADNSVDEIHCSHFMEHLPAQTVGEGDLRAVYQKDYVYEGDNGEEFAARYKAVREDLLGKDFLFAFVDECYRVLKPDAVMTVIVPNARCDRAFQDPTHRRFFVEWTFGYFASDWRKMNGLDHYRVKCHFGTSVTPIVPIEMTTLHPDAQARRFRENWNTVWDWNAVMKALK